MLAAPTGPSSLSGDVMPNAQSQQDEKLSKSSEINNAWQIGATDSNERDTQNDGLSEVMLNDGAHHQRKQGFNPDPNQARNSDRSRSQLLSMDWIYPK